MHEWARKEDPTFSFALRRQLTLCRCNRDTRLDPSVEPSWSCKLVEGTGICCLALVRASWPFMKIRTASALLVCCHAMFTGQTCFFWDSLAVWSLSTYSEQWQLYRHTELAQAAWVLDSICSRYLVWLSHTGRLGHCWLATLMNSVSLRIHEI